MSLKLMTSAQTGSAQAGSIGEPRDINGPVFDDSYVLDGSAPYQGDTINPPHYKKGDIEVIDLTRHLGFREGNIVKYAARHKDKGGKEDMLKLIWYAQDILDTDYGC